MTSEAANKMLLHKLKRGNSPLNKVVTSLTIRLKDK